MSVSRIRPRLVYSACCLLAAAIPITLRSQQPAAEPSLTTQINAIPAWDNHAHPVLPPPDPAAPNPDRDFDALPVDQMEPQTDPVAWRTDFAQLPAAWKALWNFEGSAPLNPEAQKRLEAARITVRTREGDHFDEWVLTQSNIEVMTANRVALGPGIAAPHFRWVPYADALLLPLDTSSLAKGNPDRALFYPLEDKLRARYLKDLGLTTIPKTLPEYLAKVVTPTLEHQHAAGAIAEKFEIAYLRGFDFTKPTQVEAERIYARWAGKPSPSDADYKLLQDFLLRYIARECGRLHMAVHLHAMAGGGGYFGIAGANPLLLEPLFNDRTLRHTNFVLLHGGWPFVHEAGALLQKPNVFLDISQQSLTFPARTLATWLREWLETYPGKVLFGTDGYPYSEAMGWEESTWIASRNARKALALALTGMVEDNEIPSTRALEIAHHVLHDTAAALYPQPSGQP